MIGPVAAWILEDGRGLQPVLEFLETPVALQGSYKRSFITCDGGQGGHEFAAVEDEAAYVRDHP